MSRRPVRLAARIYVGAAIDMPSVTPGAGSELSPIRKASMARAAAATGFVGIELHEARIDDAWIERKPKWRELRDWPISFAWLWRLDRS